MKRSVSFFVAAAILFLLSTVQFLRTRERLVKAAVPASSATHESLISAPGRVEAISEEIRVSSELSGRLHSVPVEEGDRVHRGQVLAQIENQDYLARVSAAEATLAQRQAELQRTINGARSQERRAAEATVQSARAVLDNARREAERRRSLADHQMISQDEADRYQRVYQVAQAEFERGNQEFSLIDAEVRIEDRRRAEAAVASAQAQLAEARAYLEKTSFARPSMA